MRSLPERRALADLLVEALGPGDDSALARTLCQECLREALEGDDPPLTFADLVRVLDSCPRRGAANRAPFLGAVRGIARTQPDLALTDFARSYIGRRGPGRT